MSSNKGVGSIKGGGESRKSNDDRHLTLIVLMDTCLVFKH